MARYKILSTGNVIVADQAFVEVHYPNDYELLPEVVSTIKAPITKLEYMNRFTDAELAGIYTAAKAVIQIEIWLEKFKLATEIDLTDSRTIAGVQALEAAGLIGEGRAAEILA